MTKRAGCWSVIVFFLVVTGFIFAGWHVLRPHLDEETGAAAIPYLRDITGDIPLASAANLESAILAGLVQDGDVWCKLTCDPADYQALVAFLATDSGTQKCDSGTVEFKPVSGTGDHHQLFFNGELYELSFPFEENGPEWWKPSTLNGCWLTRLFVRLQNGQSRDYYLFYNEETHQAYFFLAYG